MVIVSTPIVHVEALWNHTLMKGGLGAKASAEFAKQWFSIIKKQYGAPFRKYHTFCREFATVNRLYPDEPARHIEFMLREFERVEHLAKNPAHVVVAIFMHDFIYVCGSKTNERDSAVCAEALLLQMGAPRKTITTVRRLIIATRHLGKPLRAHDERLISDLDLYGFSLSYDTVLGQSRDVRREFSKFSDEEFRKGHGDFLSSMLTRRIYQTDHFSQYELAARENIQRVLANMDQVVMARPTDKRL